MQTQEKDAWSGTGYDASPGTGGGIYLRLKEKNEKVRLRLVSEPYRFVDVLKTDDGTKALNKAAWLAIHKYMEHGKPHKRVVVFQAGPMVYGLIKDLAENPEWGDPKLYDIEVTRTEQAGKYYTVAALPKPIGPISEEDAALVKDSGIDLVKACTKDSTSPVVTQPEAEDPFADE
jgi:hypothetical protein